MGLRTQLYSLGVLALPFIIFGALGKFLTSLCLFSKLEIIKCVSWLYCGNQMILPRAYLGVWSMHIMLTK